MKNILINKLLSAILAILTAFSFSPPAQERCEPAFTGTFLQSWLSRTWDDERWEAEVAAMQKAGIHTLILQTCASKSGRADGGRWSLYYNSELETFKNAVRYRDVIEPALRHCSGSGIKVFIGLCDFDDFWTEVAYTSQYYDVCGVAADMAEEIYGKYRDLYPDAFGGWYFPLEISNSVTNHFNTFGLCTGLNTVIDRVNSLDPLLPLMLSPYSSDYLSLGSLASAIDWIELLKFSHLRDGDIFAPQDAIGAGNVSEKNLRKNWEIYRRAVDSCNTELQLWANCESFTLSHECSVLSGIFAPAATENTKSVTASLERFVSQMKLASKYCDNIITFSYNHYLSPNIVSPIFMETYFDYIENGCVLEKNAPGAVPDFNKEQVSEGVLLTWTEAEDDFGIAYYRICMDGKFLTRIEQCFTDVDNSFLVEDGAIGSDYTIVAYDAAGNASVVSYAA